MDLDLSPFGFDRTVTLQGDVVARCEVGSGLLLLFGENHSDREMIRLNLCNALILLDAGIVGCLGTEIPLRDLDPFTDEDIRQRSTQLFQNHGSDAGVISHLLSGSAPWHGNGQFANMLRVLRPCVPVRCVETDEMRQRMDLIAAGYLSHDLGAGPHPDPLHPNMADHSLNEVREEAMMAEMLAFWNNGPQSQMAAILNTGSAHSMRLYEHARRLGLKCIYIQAPARPTPDPFGR